MFRQTKEGWRPVHSSFLLQMCLHFFSIERSVCYVFLGLSTLFIYSPYARVILRLYGITCLKTKNIYKRSKIHRRERERERERERNPLSFTLSMRTRSRIKRYHIMDRDRLQQKTRHWMDRSACDSAVDLMDRWRWNIFSEAPVRSNYKR